MTATVTEMEILENLDFDPEIECSLKDCDNDADWITERICCGLKETPCEGCRQGTIRMMHTDPHFAWFECHVCLTRVPAGSYPYRSEVKI